MRSSCRGSDDRDLARHEDLSLDAGFWLVD